MRTTVPLGKTSLPPSGPVACRPSGHGSPQVRRIVSAPSAIGRTSGRRGGWTPGPPAGFSCQRACFTPGSPGERDHTSIKAEEVNRCEGDFLESALHPQPLAREGSPFSTTRGRDPHPSRSVDLLLRRPARAPRRTAPGSRRSATVESRDHPRGDSIHPGVNPLHPGGNWFYPGVN